jgi:hypothetical protein
MLESSRVAAEQLVTKGTSSFQLIKANSLKKSQYHYEVSCFHNTNLHPASSLGINGSKVKCGANLDELPPQIEEYFPLCSCWQYFF